MFRGLFISPSSRISLPQQLSNPNQLLKKEVTDQGNEGYLSDAVADGKANFLGKSQSVLGIARCWRTGVLRSGRKVLYGSRKNALLGKQTCFYEQRIIGGALPREVGKRPTNVPYFSVHRSECKNNQEHVRVYFPDTR